MMKTKFFYSKVILLMLAMVLSAQGLWAEKIDPELEITLDDAYKIVPVGQANFTKPGVSLKTYTDAEKTTVDEVVTSYYTITYYILNADETTPSYTSDANSRDITTDDITGTTVSKNYGTVTIGHKHGGTVTVHVKATPKTAFTSQYEEKEGTYEFTVNTVTPTVVLPSEMTIHAFTSTTATGIYLNGEESDANRLYNYVAKSEVLALPPTNIYVEASGGFHQDLSRLYNVSYSFAKTEESSEVSMVKTDDNVNMKIDMTEHPDNTPLQAIRSEVEAEYPHEGYVTLTVNYTVKDKETYGGYNDAQGTVTIHVVRSNFNSLITSISLAEPHSTKETAIIYSRWNDAEKTGYTTNACHPLPVPTVTNNNGVDVTGKVRIKYEIVEEDSEADNCLRNHINPWGEVWEAGQSLGGSLNPGYYNHISNATTDPYYQDYKPGYVKFKAYAISMPTDEAYNEFNHLDSVGFTLSEGEKRISDAVEFWVYIKKRVPQITLYPDPSNVTLSTENTIDMNSRFNISGYVSDEYDGTAGTVTYGAQWGAGDDTFWYTFEFEKESGIEVVDWPHPDRVEMYIETKDDDGNVTSSIKVTPSMEWGILDEKDANGYDQYGMKEVYREADNWDVTHDKSEITRFVYWSVKGFNTDNVWKMRFTKENDACQIKYRIYPFNHARWDVSDEYVVTYKIVQAVEPTLHIDPNHLSALVNQKDFVEPEVWVTDPEGKEITSVFKFKYTITDAGGTGTTVASPEGDNYTTVGKPDHEITIGSTIGDVTVNVKATTEEVQYSPQTLNDTYTIHIFNEDFTDPLYEIINSKDDGAVRNDGNTGTSDYAYSQDKVMGKLHFIKAGFLYTGYSIDGIPGLILRFGKYDGSSWSIIEDTSGDITGKCNTNDNDKKCIAYDETPVVLESNGIATSGAFLEFTSATNGLLRVDARWEQGQSYTLIDFDNPDVVQVYSPTETTKGEYTFPYPLLADHSYQLYCSTEGQLNFHGIAFDPVFIKTREGGEVKKGSSFLNGYQNVPTLALDNTANVTYEIDADTNKNTSNEDCATIETASIHKVTALHFTILDKTVSTMPDATESTDVVIRSRVLSSLNADDYASAGHTHGVPFKLPYYQLSIADIPTYRLGDNHDTSDAAKDAYNYQPTPGVEVTTYNIPTAITMTYGGWKNSYDVNSKVTTDTYDVKTDNEVAGYTSTDNQFSRHIDGFSWSNVGKTNPVSENNKGDYKAYRWAEEHAETDSQDADTYYRNTFDLPAKGAYWKFEPEEDGVIFVYLVQNGVCQYTGNANDLINTTKSPQGLDWKPLYVVDESGKPADMLEASSMATINQFVASGGNGENNTDDESDAYTEGLVRASISDPNIMRFRSLISSSNEAQDKDAYNQTLADLNSKLVNAATLAKSNPDEAKLDSCMYLWKYNNSSNKEAGFELDYKDTDQLRAMKLRVLKHWSNPGERQVIFQDVNGPGYAMVSKAYVRYAINAKAGKTYWVFQQGSKPNLCGFGFVPYWFPNNEKVTNQEITLSDNTSLETSLNGKDLNKTSDVTYTRTFKNNTWTSLCLPFSVSQRNFKKVFGDDAQIVTYDGVTNSGTNAHFIQHNYHMMEAGRGYFIKPAWTDIGEDEQKNGVTFENVTIETKVDDEHEYDASTLTDMPQLNKFTMYDHEEYKTNKVQALRMVGTFDGEYMPAYSYFINGSLYRNTASLHCGRYRAYLKNPNVPDIAPLFAKIGGSTFEEPYEDVESEEPTVTRINGVHDVKSGDMTDLGLADGIYNISGQKVGSKNSSAENFNKGVYIINGKKVAIK